MNPTAAAAGERVRSAPRRPARRPLLAALLATLLVAAAVPAASAATDAERVGHPLPRLDLTDLEGIPLDLSELRGKVVHLVFTAVWCEPCQGELHSVRELALRHGRRGYRLVFVGVRTRQDAKRLAAWADEAGFDPHQVCYDGKGSAAKTLGVRFLPHHVLVDREGRIHTVSDRLPDELDELLRSLLEEESR